MVNSSRGVVFFTGNPEKCPQTGYGQCKFYFLYMPTINDSEWKYHYNKGLEPFKWTWDGKQESAIQNCKKSGSDNGKWCTLVIQLNGWKIPEDYPYKVSY